MSEKAYLHINSFLSSQVPKNSDHSLNSLPPAMIMPIQKTIGEVELKTC